MIMIGVLRLLHAPLFAALLIAASIASDARAGNLPFRAGEHLTFSIRYGIIRAGSAELSVSSGGEDGSLLLSSRAWTNDFFDVAFKVRDEVRAWVDPETIETIRFEKRLNEGKFKDEEIVVYDRERQVAVYGDGKEIPLEPGTRDILSSFYHFRTEKLPIGAKVPLTYHSSKKNWSVHVNIERVESVKVPAGTFRCFRVEPFLKSIGVFKQTGRLLIWVTADERRMPVKMESKVVFGAFEAVLTDYQTP